MADNSTAAYETLSDFQIICAAIAFYNSFEVFGLIFLTFSKYRSLYFWSLIASSVGIIWFVGGFLDLFYHMYEPNRSVYEPLFILTLGWYGMVTGFALVLYSRLHLIGVPKQYIFYAKCFICYNIVFSHFPTTTLTFGSNINGAVWTYGYSIMEKIQMTFFSLQEIILSSLYLYYVQRMTLSHKFTKLVKQTLVINVVVLFLDVSMLSVEYAAQPSNDLYNYQIMLKAVVYSIKLKLEFYILNVLTRSLDREGAVATGHPTNKTSSVANQELSPASQHLTAPPNPDAVSSASARFSSKTWRSVRS